MQRNADVLSAREAADYLGAHVETVRRLARRGDIPAYKMGKDWRFRRSTLRRWAEQRNEGSRPAHVLVVDDEKAIRRLIRDMLEPEGYRVSAASSGAEALALMRQDTPDVALLDLKMPGMGGPDVLREIRKAYGALPVIIITGYPDSDLMHEALRYSPVIVLAKPATRAQVMAAVRAALGRSWFSEWKRGQRHEDDTTSRP